MNLAHEAMKILDRLYEIYPSDIQIIFENLKYSLFYGKNQSVDKMLDIMRTRYESLHEDEKEKVLIENYLNFSE